MRLSLGLGVSSPHHKSPSPSQLLLLVLIIERFCLTRSFYLFPLDRLLPSSLQSSSSSSAPSNDTSTTTTQSELDQLTSFDSHEQQQQQEFQNGSLETFTEDNFLLQLLQTDQNFVEDFEEGDAAAPNVAIFWWTPDDTEWMHKMETSTSSPDPENLELQSLNPSEATSTTISWMNSSQPANRRVRLKRVRTTSHQMPRCSMLTYERCLFMMQEVMQNSSLAFPTNADDLEITCKKLKAGDYCAEKYIRTCAGDQQRLLYQDIVQGTKNVIRLICQQGETQRQYLEFASCFKDIFVSEVKCSTVLNRFQEISKLLSSGIGSGPSVNDPGSNGLQLAPVPQAVAEERLKQFCCAYRDVVDCQLKNVRKFCGTKGLEFFDKYMSEMTNSLINEHCVGYTYSDKCQPYQKEAMFNAKGQDGQSADGSNDAADGQSGSVTDQQSRMKSMLALSGVTKPGQAGATSNGNSAHYYGKVVNSRSTSWWSWLAVVFEVFCKMLASLTVSGTIYWMFIECHHM